MSLTLRAARQSSRLVSNRAVLQQRPQHAAAGHSYSYSYSYNNNKNHQQHPLLTTTNELHTFAGRLSLEDNYNDRNDRHQQRLLSALPSINGHTTNGFKSSSVLAVHSYHTTAAPERAAAIMLGLGATSATFYAAAMAVKAFNEFKASIPDTPIEEEEEKIKDEATKEEPKEQQAKKEKASGGARENIFAKWFGVGVGAKYYEGGFEEAMTRREAALILGVRESSSPKRIKDAHRKLLVLNHPDTGGSTFMSLKINEAKELLMKGRRGG